MHLMVTEAAERSERATPGGPPGGNFCQASMAGWGGFDGGGGVASPPDAIGAMAVNGAEASPEVSTAKIA
jgi:hypothetical protein